MARAKRDVLLRAYRHRLRREDLEDCFSQAALELVAQARKGRAFSSRIHLGNVLEQRFVSRINDRRRALCGRSPMQAAMESAVSLGGSREGELDIADTRADPETLVMLRHELTRVEHLAREQLTRDQRLVLAYQIGLPLLSPREFCGQFGWSQEKYRKVAQRARARLRHLMADEEPDVPAMDRRRNSDQGPTYDDNLHPHRNVPKRDAGG